MWVQLINIVNSSYYITIYKCQTVWHLINKNLFTILIWNLFEHYYRGNTLLINCLDTTQCVLPVLTLNILSTQLLHLFMLIVILILIHHTAIRIHLLSSVDSMERDSGADRLYVPMHMPMPMFQICILYTSQKERSH